MGPLQKKLIVKIPAAVAAGALNISAEALAASAAAVAAFPQGETTEELPTAQELVDNNTRAELDAIALDIDPTFDTSNYATKADVADFIVANR